MRVFLALLPIALLLALLLGARVSAGKAAWIALAVSLVVVFTTFPFGAAAEASMVENLTGVALEGVFVTATILWILLPALAIHELQIRTGALRALRRTLEGAAPDGPTRALLIGWFFALFLEGAAGFGTPLAIAAPMLVAIGLPALPAVAIALVGHIAGVAFGAVGTPVLAQAELAAAPVSEISRWSAFLLLPLAWVSAVYVLRAAQAHGSGAGRWRDAALAVLFFCVPFALAALFIGPELPTLAGALLGGIAFVAYLRRSRTPSAAQAPQQNASFTAAAPYLIVIVLILLTRMIAPLKAAASSVKLEWALDHTYSGSMLPLYHPGTLLVVAFILGGFAQRAKPSDFIAALRRAATRLAPAVVALVAMLVLSRLMLHAGMITELAQAAVGAVGDTWPVIAPSVGALGSFVTGSATASNILFTNLQEEAVTALGLPLAVVLALQTIGAAVGNAICPHNIIAGAAAVGASGREGEILRRTLPVCLLMLAGAGILALWVVRFVT